MTACLLGWFVTAARADEPVEPPPPEPTPAQEDEGALAEMWRRVRDQRVPVIRADGTRAAPILGAAGAALAIGGVVLAVGGVGAWMLWRGADTTEPEG